MDLPISLAPALLELSDPAEQRRVAALAMQRQLTVAQLGDFVRGSVRQGKSADVRTSARAAPRRPPARAGAAATTRKGAAAAAPAALTRSEARALLVGEGVATFEEMAQTLDDACDGCDEKQYPEICRACPLPQFVGNLVKEMGRDG